MIRQLKLRAMGAANGDGGWWRLDQPAVIETLLQVDWRLISPPVGEMDNNKAYFRAQISATVNVVDVSGFDVWPFVILVPRYNVETASDDGYPLVTPRSAIPELLQTTAFVTMVARFTAFDYERATTVPGANAGGLDVLGFWPGETASPTIVRGPIAKRWFGGLVTREELRTLIPEGPILARVGG